MNGFRNPEAAGEILIRIRELTHLDLSPQLQAAALEAPDPDKALGNLESWLSRTSSPATYLSAMAASTKLASVLIGVLGSSQSLADALSQNPEFAAWITDPHTVAAAPSRSVIVAEGRSLLESATSYSHGLDRLRYLRQKWILPIVVSDLAGLWAPESVWESISVLAEAIIELAVEWVWAEFKRSRDLDCECPLSVAGYGKLGGQELNYSSDIDLVYILEDGADERAVGRLSTMLTHALQDRMGRGALYRVDLRLRPYGGAGAMTPTMKAIESYYHNHAEIWEVQALLRSRVIVGPSKRWDKMRSDVCFRPKLSELAIEEMVAMRERVESDADEADLKRGPGGIRDIEFLCQAFQLVHGHASNSLQVRPTVKALAALQEHGMMDERACQTLTRGYTLYRQVEHRLQLESDLQTHTLPTDPHAQKRLARVCGRSSWGELEREIKTTKMAIREIYNSNLCPTDFTTARSWAIAEFGPSIALWFDLLPEPEAYYESVRDNQGSAKRVRIILEEAPTLIGTLAQSLSVTEAILSGEIEEEVDSIALKIDCPLNIVATTFTTEWLACLIRWLLTPTLHLGSDLCKLSDSHLNYLADRVQGQFDMVALGSYAIESLSPGSDLDLLLLIDDTQPQADAEMAAQQLLSVVSTLRHMGSPLEIDLRLRNEGRQGLLVRTYAGFAAYELERMEMWERFALGQVRQVRGEPRAVEVALKAAYAQPVTPERLQELVKMKRRIEAERNQAKYFRRQVKLGYGGLSDIEWFVHLYEMRYPTAVKAGQNRLMEDRLRAISQARLINALELDELISAWRHLTTTRIRLWLLGFADDIVPENPDKLDKLAHITGLRDGNDFLRLHEHVIEAVRSIYLEGLERLNVEA